MNRALFKFSFLSLTIMIFFLACSKSGKTDQQLQPRSTTSLSIADARAWFELETKAKNTQAIARSGPSKYFDIPNWDSAVYHKGANNIGYWKVPLTSKEKITRQLTIYMNKRRQGEVIMPNPWLLIFQDSAKNTKMLVMQSIPYPSEKGKGAGFAGEMKMYDWDGDFEVGFVYENGKKRKQITSSKSSLRRTGNPNGRWELMCIDYIDCEFQSQCTAFNTLGFYVHVAFALVRDQISCYYPSDDPYASAWNANHGVSWTCGGWEQTGTTHVNICEDVWIDDIPDPDPEPYIPDPTIDTEGYGVQTITNNFTNPCQWKVANDIMNLRMASEIVKMAHDIFGVSAKTNLIFKPQSDYFIEYPNVPWPSHVAARHGATNNNGIITSSIFLNDSMLANSSQEYLAATILHEILHAILSATADGSENYEHNQMASTYLAQSTALLMDLYGLSEPDAKALNIDGLRNTVLGSAIYNMFPSQWNSIVATATAFRNGTSGIACP